MPPRLASIYDWSGWDRIGIGTDLNNLRRFITESEDTLKSRLKRFEADIDDRVSGMNDEARTDFCEWIQDDHWRISEQYPKFFRRSILITIYSRFEYELICACHYSKKKYKVRSSPDPFMKKLGIVFGSHAFLTTESGLPSLEKSYAWDQVSLINTIRNRFVHNNGVLRRTDSSIEEYASNNPRMAEITATREVILRRNFCIDAINTVEYVLKHFKHHIENTAAHA